MKSPVYRCVPIASVSRYNSQAQIVFVRNAPRPRGEYAIVEADFGPDPTWLNALDDNVEIITIANAVDEFCRRAVAHAIDGNNGFRYWTPDAFWAKYGNR